MNGPSIDRLRAQCGGPRDGALLRFALGQALAAAGASTEAAAELERALEFDPQYSAAWRALGQARLAAGEVEAAAGAFERGIATAQRRGDQQAAREMQVFLARIRKAAQ